jgi:hypothetical protein
MSEYAPEQHTTKSDEQSDQDGGESATSATLWLLQHETHLEYTLSCNGLCCG